MILEALISPCLIFLLFLMTSELLFLQLLFLQLPVLGTYISFAIAHKTC